MSRDAGLAMQLVAAADKYMKEINYWIDDHDPLSSWQLTPDYVLTIVRVMQSKPHDKNSCITIYRLYPDFFLYLSFFFLTMAMAASIIYYTL